MPTYNTNPLYNYLNVEIIVNNNTQQKFYFPDIPQLRDAKIQGLSYYPNILMGTDYNNVQLMTTAVDLRNSFLTLYSGNKEAIQNLPLYKLVNLGNVGNVDGIFNIDNLMVDFSKSYVSFSLLPLTTIPPFSIMFGVFYIK